MHHPGHGGRQAYKQGPTKQSLLEPCVNAHSQLTLHQNVPLDSRHFRLSDKHSVTLDCISSWAREEGRRSTFDHWSLGGASWDGSRGPSSPQRLRHCLGLCVRLGFIDERRPSRTIIRRKSMQSRAGSCSRFTALVQRLPVV